MNENVNDTEKPEFDSVHSWQDKVRETLPGLSTLTFDRDMNVVSAGGPGVELLAENSHLEGRPLAEVLPQDIWGTFEMELRGALEGKPHAVELPRTERRGRYWVRVDPVVHDGQVIGGTINASEAADQMLAETNAARVTASFEVAFDRAPIGMAMISLDGTIIRSNAAFSRFLQRTSDDIAGMGIGSLIHPGHIEESIQAASRLMSGELASHLSEMKLLSPSGEPVWFLVAAAMVSDEDGQPASFVIQIQDVSKQKSLEQELARLAGQDDLTGLANRRTLEHELGRRIERFERYGEAAGLLLLDLDGFKGINDRFGHGVGDDVLIHVAESLRDSVRSGDTVCRLGGDEFAVIALGLEAEAVEGLRDELTRRFDDSPFVRNGVEIPCPASVGACEIGLGIETPGQALRLADRSMYSFKELRKSGD